MSPRENSGSIQEELLKLKAQVGLLEGLCGEDFSEAAVKAAAKDIAKHIDRIAELVDTD